MSIAKKSIKWLVATIVIFALILTVSLAVGSVTRASATTPEDTEHDVNVHVFATDSADLGTFPDLIKSTSARTVTVYYCYDIPTDATSTLSEFFAAPVLKYGNTTVRPTQIDLNNNFSSIVEISMHTSAAGEYLASSGAATAFNIALKAGATAADLNSYISGAFDQTKYLFSAQYAIAANAVGAYELDFGTPTMFSLSSSDDLYYPAIENGDFNIRAIIPIPTAVEGLVYTGAEQTGVTVDYTLGYDLDEGSIAETNKGNYSATFTLLDDATTCWEGNTITDKTVNWSIAKMQIAIPEVGSGTYTYTGAPQTYAFAAEINSTYIEITDGTKTDAGTYTVTASLKDTANTRWAGEGDDVADKVYNNAFVINPFTVAIPEAKSGVTYTYDGTTQTFLYEDELLTDYYTYEPVNGKNAGNYEVVFELKDKDNTVWTGNTITDKTVQFTIAPKTVTLAFTSNNYYATYNNEITAPVVTAEGVVAGDDLNLGVDGTPEQGDDVGEYDLTATWDTENTNYTVTGAAATYTINTRYIPIPVKDTTVTYTYTGEPLTFEFTEDVDAAYVVLANNVKTLPGTYTVTANLNTAVHGNNIAWADNGEGEYEYEFVIDPAMVSVSFVGVFNDVEKPLAEDVALAVLANLPTYNVRWFKQGGYTFDNAAATTVTFDMDGETVYIAYSYAVGAGDADGDGIITAGDVIQMKRFFVGLDADNLIETAADAWSNSSNSDYDEVAVLNTALDVNGTLTFRTNDIVAVREALATGYDYKVVIEEGIQLVKKVNRITVTTYEELDGAGWSLLKAVKAGYPVTLGADIAAANEDFVLDSAIPVDINLGGYRLTVKGFTLNTNTTGATLKITNGTLYTVNGITVTAPSGNVIVSGVNGYSYDGTSVNLAAYSESLHIENNVAFYIYHQKVDNQPVALADFVETVTSADALNVIAGQRIQDTAVRMAEIKEIKESTTLTEEQKATAINAKEVKKAIIEVPIDTHVVVEENANLSVDKLVVKAQSDENAPAVTTFAIEVKNAAAAAEVVAVDISEVKDVINNEKVFVVDEVAIAGVSSKVEVITGENTAADVTKYFAQIGSANYETLQAAINAAANGDVIKLLDNVTNGTGIEVPDGQVKNITIDFNGKTYTVTGGPVGSTNTKSQAMHWADYSTITLKNGTFVVAASANTVVNGKSVKMAMQNYADLTIKDMTIDLSAINVAYYGVYTQEEYVKYSNLERPLFNLNRGSMVIDNSTITFPANSTKGVYLEESATIKNSTINGYIALSGDHGTPSVEIINSTFDGVVSYFEGYGVKHSGNVYRLGGVSVTNATELQAALDAGAVIIDIENDFNAPNPIAVSKSTIINGFDHTITSNGNRIMNVTEAGVVLTINDLTLTKASNVVERGLNIWNEATGTDITLNNVTIDAWLYAINYVNGADNETLTINNSTITGWAAINAHCNNSTFTVTDSTLYGINRNCDSQYGFSTVVIDGDSLHGSQEGDHGVDNTFVFDGCTIIAEVTLTHQYWISFQYAATGNVASVVVNNCEILDAPNGNDKSADMNITGTNNAVVMALSAEQYAIVAAKHFNITDNGNGTYTIMPKTANISYFGTAYNFYDVFENGWLEDTEAFTLTDDVVLDVDVVFARNRAAAIAVSGGTFEMNLDGNTISGVGKILLPVGVTCVTDSDVSIAGIFEAPEGEVVIESVDADGNYIYAVGVAYVKTKAEFTAAITAGAKTLVICADINLSMYTYNRDMDITIDLNGHTLSATMTGITFSAARTLNIVDSSANGTGAINSTGNYAINMGTSSTADTVINVYGGTLTGKTSAAVKVNDGTLNVYGGTLTCPAADKYAILNYQGYAGTVNIIDGTFTAAVPVANNGTGEVNIYGGTFSADPSDFVASGYMAVEDEGTWTVVEAEITITTFAELKAAIADVNAGNIVYPTLIIANDIAFEEELTISKSVYLMGDGEVKFIGYDASTKYDEAFYINVADEDQEITIDGIVFDHFCYYSNVANKTKATNSAVKNAVAYITYGGNCPASTTLYITGCQFLGTARDMINASSTIGCKGFIAIEDCVFDATDRLSNTLNMLSFYGNEDAELYVMITDCTFKEATEQNATWATSAIASFGNADITVTGCEFIACQVAIGIDNTFDKLFSTSTYPVYYNTTTTLVENTYTNCYFGYYEESVVASTDDIPEGFELDTDSPYTIGDYPATQFTAYEYDCVEPGTYGVDAKYLTIISYYVKA